MCTIHWSFSPRSGKIWHFFFFVFMANRGKLDSRFPTVTVGGMWTRRGGSDNVAGKRPTRLRHDDDPPRTETFHLFVRSARLADVNVPDNGRSIFTRTRLTEIARVVIINTKINAIYYNHRARHVSLRIVVMWYSAERFTSRGNSESWEPKAAADRTNVT